MIVSKLLNDTSITSEKVNEYKKRGVIKIDQMFSLETIKRLQASVLQNVKEEDQPDGVVWEFDKFSNEFANRDEFYHELADQIITPLNKLTTNDLTVTQIAILELEVGEGKGFEWHFDEYSFSFVNVESPGHTLWVPLNPIDVEGQNGGMCWVHQNDFSGACRIKQWEYFQMANAEQKKKGGDLSKAKYKEYPVWWAGEYDKIMLEDLKKSCNLDLGDVLVFNRNTWHRSEELLPNGPLKCRKAIIFRVIDLNSIINRTLFEKTIERMELEGGKPPQSFGHRLGSIQDGNTLRDAVNAGVSF